MHSLGRDLVYALRSLARSPMFTAVAVVSLALGIGANAAIFTFIDQVLLRMLPVKDPRSLVLVATRGPHLGSNAGQYVLSYPMYKDYRDKNLVFTGVMCTRTVSATMSCEGGAEFTEVELVSGNYFDVLGLTPAAGRLFTPQDETAPGANAVAVLSHTYWRNRFRGDPSILGKTIRISGFPITVVGVATPGYHGTRLGQRTKIFVPVTMKKQVTPAWDDLENRRARWVQVYGRLRPGVSAAQAEAFLRILHKQIIGEEVKEAAFSRASEYSKRQFLSSSAVVMPAAQGYSSFRERLKTPLKVLMALVTMVLLIACANVSNLLVARAAGRGKEVAVRLALGAGRWRIIRQLLVESLLLALAGGALGIAVSYWTGRAMILLAPTEQAREALSAAPDARTLCFTLAISLLSALCFGLLPALQTARAGIAPAMKSDAGSIAGGRGARTRKVLVAAQVTLSLVLLTGTGLFIRSLRNLRDVAPGFRATNLIQFSIDPQLSGYSKERARDTYGELQERLGRLPGVESVAVARVAVMEGSSWDSSVTIEGYDAKEGEDINPAMNAVSPGYFKTLGIPLRAGRECGKRDNAGAPRVVLVNEAFALRYFGERSPVGRHIAFGRGIGVKPDVEIAGVVSDAKYSDLRKEVPSQVFRCHAQEQWTTGMVVYVRTSLPSERMFASVRSEMNRFDASLPVYDLHTMEEQLDRSLSIERLVAFLSGAYGALAALLAVLGIYGVTAYGVARRAREIGIRMALGAESGRVVRMVLRDVLVLAGAGLAAGLPLAFWLTQLVHAQLYGVEPRDPATMALSVLGLLAVAVAAGAVPALKASRLDPVTVLRYE